MSDGRSKTTRVDLSGAALDLEGEQMVISEGEFRVDTDHLYAADDPPDNPTQTIHYISVTVEELRRPDE